MIPPCSERDEKKAMIRDTRSRLMRLRLRVLEQREVYRLAVPLLCHYSENSLKMKSWLDEGEERSQAYIDMHDNDIVLLQHADEIEVGARFSTFETIIKSVPLIFTHLSLLR